MIWQYLVSILHPITSIFTLRPSPGMPQPAPQIDAQRSPVPGDIFEYTSREPGPLPRLSFGHGSELSGYPSTGGILILDNPHPILLQHLSIDRFTAIPSQRESDPVAEDAFCKSLKKIGARWWRSFYAKEVQADSDPGRPKPDYVYTGWPKSGGVWFLQLNETEFHGSRVSLLAMTLDMEEYCNVLETIGAKFYEDPKDCEYLKDVV